MNRLRNEDRVNVSANHMPRASIRSCATGREFRRMHGDRVQKHMFNGRPHADQQHPAARALAAQIDRAMVGESARWGDARKFNIAYPGGNQFWHRADPDTRWDVARRVAEALHELDSQCDAAADACAFAGGGLYPTTAPQFSQFGGAVTNGFTLALTQTNVAGVIFSRLMVLTHVNTHRRDCWNGAVVFRPDPDQRADLVRARVYDSGNWSALVEATFYPPQDLSKLALTEIMYNPPAIGATPGNNLEFLELKNTGTNTLNLSGLTFTSGITFTFTNGTTLGPGQFFVLARNAAAFASKYPGVTIHGTYTGQLDNAGEQLTLAHALGTPIFL